MMNVFWFCALAGTAMFAIQFLMLMMGTDLHSHETDDSNMHLADGKFKWLTRHALTGFVMMFGWTGLTCLVQFHLTTLETLLISFGIGIVTALISRSLFRLAQKAHSSGTVFKMDETIGCEATVYLRIPKNGSGKISISLHDHSHEIEAVSEGEEIPSFTKVKIIKKMSDTKVIVAPIK